MKLTKKTALLALGIIAVFITGVIAGYVWYSLTIPFRVIEPLELVEPPAFLELMAGQNKTFEFNVINHADVDYLVTLTFTLSDSGYQESYVTFSEIAYTVIPGENTLEAWVKVGGDAPAPVGLELTIEFSRAAPT